MDVLDLKGINLLPRVRVKRYDLALVVYLFTFLKGFSEKNQCLPFSVYSNFTFSIMLKCRNIK